MNKRITLGDIFKVYFRSFLYQNVLNEKYMQNFGFMFVLYPVLKKFSNSVEELKKELMIHFEYFNTNPYFASFVFGVSLNLIEKGESNKIKKFKFETMTSLAGLGDALSWGIIKSFLALIGMGLILFNHIEGFLIFFVIYNLIFNIFFRFFGIVMGYKYGQRVIFKIAELDLQKMISLLKQSGLFLTGMLFYILLYTKYKLLEWNSKHYVISIFYFLIISVIVYFFYNLNKKVIPVVSFLIYFVIIVFIYIKF